MLRPIVFSLLLAYGAVAQAQLPPAVSQQLAAAKIADDAISVLVLRGDTALVSHFAERAMQPASTIKVLTTLVGLEQLGPAFRGRTELRSAAPVLQETLMGDLVLHGGADADLDTAALTGMLQNVRNQGIRKIDGRIVQERALFNPPRSDRGLPPFDESPDAYYNVIPDALLVNKNMLLLDMRSSAERVQVVMQPSLDNVSIESGFTLIDTDCAKWEDGWKQPQVLYEAAGRIRIVLKGTYPKNCARGNSINVLDRQDYVDRLVRQVWKQLGGEVTGAGVDAGMPAGTRLLAEHVSRSLPEVVRDINKPSDNTLARTVFLSLGSLEFDAVAGSKPLPVNAGETTFSRTDAAIRNWMRKQGIHDAGLVLENGSGLSRTEKISALQMAGVLQAGLRSKWAPEYQASLPIAGVDGTMRRRLKDTPAFERARIKTGGLSNVVAIAGYVPDADGQLCVVVAMINSEKAGSGRAALDALVEWVARTSAARPPM
jgi:D-alanyl-D-alanine carboxypeptidase/D-alanyl-D-alanine-endopeptidase (penicillin-binding protein 4)